MSPAATALRRLAIFISSTCAGLLELVGLVPAGRAAVEHVAVRVRIHHQPRAVLAREPDRLVVEHRGVLDRAHAGADRALDALGAVRMHRDVAPLVRGSDDGGTDLLLGVVRHGRIGARGHHAARREQLDPVGAVLDVLAHLLTDLIGPVGERLVALDVDVLGQLVVVAVTAGRRERLDRDQHARPGNAARRDRIAQRDVGEIAAAEVAHRRESGEQRLARVRHALDRGARRGLLEILVRRLLLAAREVHVGVDEPRQQRHVAEIDVDGLRPPARGATETIVPFSMRITWSRSTRPVSTSSSRAAVTVSACAAASAGCDSPMDRHIDMRWMSRIDIAPWQLMFRTANSSRTRPQTWAGV